jgi:hypothetical protein
MVLYAVEMIELCCGKMSRAGIGTEQGAQGIGQGIKVLE